MMGQQPCFAEEKQSNFQVSVGLKAIFNQWQLGDNSEVFNYDPEQGIIAGPTIKMSYKNFFGGINYLTSIEKYEFGSHMKSENAFVTGEDNTDIERNDIDALAGYMFSSYFGCFIGYKHIKYDINTKRRVENRGNLFRSIDCNTKQTSNGPAIGIISNYSIPDTNFNLCLSLAYIKLYHDTQITFTATGDLPGKYSDSSEDNGNGFSVDPIINYRLYDHISLSTGLKYQIITHDKDKRIFTEFKSSDDRFIGISFGCDYIF